MSYVIILDAGHGGLINGVYQTKGKRSPVWDDGSVYYEGVGNREIVKKLTERLEADGIEVYNSNPTNYDIPLGTRVKNINAEIRANKDKKYIGVSVHSNGFSKESAHGWSVYTYTNGSLDSHKLANLSTEAMKLEFPDRRLRGKKSANFYILKNTICPFILTENFFHTNRDECKNILMTEEGQNKIVNLHYKFITEFIK